MPDRSFSKDIFPHIQSKPPLVQLEAIDKVKVLFPVLFFFFPSDLCPTKDIYAQALNLGLRFLKKGRAVAYRLLSSCLLGPSLTGEANT